MRTSERWGSGDAYEPFIGRWSRLVAARFLQWLHPVAELRWLDVGCGTGALTQTILTEADPAAVQGIDPSDAFVQNARRRVGDPRARFSIGDARSIEAPDASFDFVVSGLVLNFVPDPAAAVTEMRRIARPGGRVACYVWDYADGMQMLRHFWDVAKELDAEVGELDESVRFPICRPEPLRALWDGAGLADVDVVPIEIPTVFESFDDYWDPFLGGQGPAPTYNMSLDEQARGKLRDLLRERLPAEGDGRIALTARAWAVNGRVTDS